MNPAKNQALFVIDMQNGFCDEKGFMNKVGLGHDLVASVIAPIRRLVGAAREAGIPVIFTRTWLKPDYSDAGLMMEKWPGIRDVGGMIQDTWDAEIIDDLKPLPADIVVNKRRFSAFYGTDLEAQLKDLGIDSVVVSGCTTEICVDSTVRDAFFRDLFVTLVKDAVAAASSERHEDALRIMEFGFASLATTDEVVEAFSQLPRLATSSP